MQPLQVDLNLEFFFFVIEDMYIDCSISWKFVRLIIGLCPVYGLTQHQFLSLSSFVSEKHSLVLYTSMKLPIFLSRIFFFI